MVYEDNSPPDSQTDNIIDEINFYLKYYKKYFIQELKKALDVYEEPAEKIIEPDVEKKISPFAKVMMEHMEMEKKRRNTGK